MKKGFRIFGFFILIGIMSFSIPQEKFRLVIDAGHGGTDKGSTFESIYEKDINLSIAKKIQSFSKGKNVEVILVREDDKEVSLKDRITMINNLNPDLLLSIHINNSLDSKANGTEIYYSKANEFYKRALNYADKIISNSVDEIQMKGLKEANFTILKNTKCPALMVEVGFLSNMENRGFLTSDEGQQQVAMSILNAITNR